MIALDLSRQNQLDADPTAIQKIEFIGQLMKVDGINADEQKIYLFYICCKLSTTIDCLRFPHLSSLGTGLGTSSKFPTSFKSIPFSFSSTIIAFSEGLFCSMKPSFTLNIKLES